MKVFLIRILFPETVRATLHPEAPSPWEKGGTPGGGAGSPGGRGAVTLGEKRPRGRSGICLGGSPRPPGEGFVWGLPPVAR